MSDTPRDEKDAEDPGQDRLPAGLPITVTRAPGTDQETPIDDSGPGDEAPRRRRRWPKVLGIIALVLVIITAMLAAGGFYALKQLEGNVTTIQELEDLPTVATSSEPINVLIMGSDSRDDGNSANPNDITEGQRSDTTILVHLYEGRESALAVSIPRDTKLQLPACASSGGDWRVTDKFNASFTWGGPSCTVETVEEMTGLPIHHAVVVDFQGFKSVVEAVGGVPVCLEEAVYDRDSGLDLPAGWSTVTGDQALAFVRARKSLGDGSDIDRIARQQQFLSSAIRQATDRELLRNPVKLYKVLDAATKSLSVDEGLDSITEMASIAESLSGLRPENIKFVTLPFFYSDDGSSVDMNTEVADEIWAALANDEPWPAETASTGEGDLPLTVAPADTSVLILNGNGVDNAATNASYDLRDQGFRIAGLGAADSTAYTAPVVVYNPADYEAARTLQASVAGAILQADENAYPGQLSLIVGAEYAGAGPVNVPRTPQGTIDDPAPVTAETSLCVS